MLINTQLRSAVFGLLVVSTLAMLSSCTPEKIASWPDGVNLLTNGSFEDGTFNSDPGTPGVMSLKNGSTAMPGWTVIDNPKYSQDVAWLSNANRFVPNAATDGTHFVDLTGIGDRPDPTSKIQFGVLQQSFRTTAGALHEVSLDMGISNPAYPGPIRVWVGVAAAADPQGEVQTDCGVLDIATTGPQWYNCTVRFTARSTDTVLKIYGQLGKQYIGVDNVKVECVAPLGRHALCGNIG